MPTIEKSVTKKKTALKIRNFRVLRAFIRRLPSRACDMTSWFVAPYYTDVNGNRITKSLQSMQKRGFKCGDVGCLGGWCSVVISLRTHAKSSDISISLHALRNFLGCDGAETYVLFYQFPDDTTLRFRIDYKKWMLARLDLIIETGKIEYWDLVPELAATRYIRDLEANS